MIHRYAIRNARLFRAEGVQAGTSFPIVTPRGLRSYHAPDLTSLPAPNSQPVMIKSIEKGPRPCVFRLQSAGGRSQGGMAGVIASADSCRDRMILSDGRTVPLPEVVVFNGAAKREIAIQNTFRLLSKAQAESGLVPILVT